jgi:hypothetical protein
MSPAWSPFLATWLLHRLYSGPNVEAVIGDLLERYQTRPSSVWYWRQVFATIVVSILWEVRTHKLLAIRAALTGCAAAWCLGFVLFYVARGPVGAIVEVLSGESRHVFFGTWGPFITLVGASWVVGRLHRQSRGAMVFVFAAFVFLIDIPELHRRVVNALTDQRYVSALRGFLWTESLAMVGILLGGLSQPPPPHEDTR